MKILSGSARETLAIGRTIAGLAKAGDIICLFGQLGSGKTVLAKGIAQGLRVKGKEVISPSFVLLREYDSGKLPLYHFDLYRLKGVQEVLDLGYEEYLFGQGLSVIEWADRLKVLEPKEALSIRLSVLGGSKRELVFSAKGKRHKALLKGINENISA